MKKNIALVLGGICLILIIVTIYFMKNIDITRRITFNTSNILEYEDINDVSMTIYYRDYHGESRINWTIDMLTNYGNKIVVLGEDLKNQIYLLKQIEQSVFFKSSEPLSHKCLCVLCD